MKLPKPKPNETWDMVEKLFENDESMVRKISMYRGYTEHLGIEPEDSAKMVIKLGMKKYFHDQISTS